MSERKDDSDPALSRESPEQTAGRRTAMISRSRKNTSRRIAKDIARSDAEAGMVLVRRDLIEFLLGIAEKASDLAPNLQDATDTKRVVSEVDAAIRALRLL